MVQQVEFTDREVHFLLLLLNGLVEEPWVTIREKLGEDVYKKAREKEGVQ